MTEEEFLTLREGTIVWSNFGNQDYYGSPVCLEVLVVYHEDGITYVHWADDKGRTPKRGVLQFGVLQEPKKEMKMSDPKTVDQYQIILRERGGFSFVVLQLLTSDSQTTEYEFHPAFAHALSDELLKASAHAAPKAAKG